MWKYVTAAIGLPVVLFVGAAIFTDDSPTDSVPTTTTSMVLDTLPETTTTTLVFPPTTPYTGPENTGYAIIPREHTLDIFDDPIYSSCVQANLNGYGPYFRDVDNEYWFYLDSNGDGVVCQ